jgi:hypothetical protein
VTQIFAPRLKRRAAFLLLGALLSVGASCGRHLAASEAAAPSQGDFRAILEESGFNEDSFEAFNEWRGGVDPTQGETLARLLFRLQQYEAASVSRDRAGAAKPYTGTPRFSETSEPGQLVQLDARAVDVDTIELPEVSAELLQRKSLSRCTLKLPGGSEAIVIALHRPSAWDRAPNALDEPVSLQAVVLGSAQVSGERQPLLLATRLSWRPSANASAGVLWLARQGFDASLLDEVRHNQPFVTDKSSLEPEAFYDCLQIVADAESAELAKLARAGLPLAIGRARVTAEAAADLIARMDIQWATASAAERTKLRTAMNAARRNKQMSEAIIARAETGLSSVWQAVLQPRESTGDAFVIEGVARRAVRVVVEESAWDRPQFWPAAADGRSGEYYELDVFSSEPQHPPAICCVNSLPEGFPVGEVIREPVRVAGVFFKNWAYVHRVDEDSARRDKPGRIAPPLFIAAQPQWLRSSPVATSSRRDLWAGIAFLALFIGVGLVLARISRRDRLAQARRARYDLPLQVDVER